MPKPGLTEEHLELLHFELMKLIIAKKFFNRPRTEIADELAKLTNPDGTLMFQIDGNEPDQRTFTRYIKKFVEQWEDAFAPMLRGKLMEKMVEATEKVEDNPQMMKVLADKTMPQVTKHEVKHEGELQHSAELTALFIELRQLDLTQISETGSEGADCLLSGAGEEGHEVSLRSNIGPPERLALDVVPQGNDRPVHVCGDDEEAEGCAVPGASGVLEDDPDNRGGNDMDNHQ